MSAPSPRSVELPARLDHHLVELLWRNNEEGPGPRRKEWAGATGVASALPTELSNVLFVTAPPPDAPQLIRDAREFFRPAPTWRISAPSRLRDVVGPAALAAGMNGPAAVPRLLLSPIPDLPALPPGLTIRAVRTGRALRDFWHAGGRGFRIPVWVLRVALPEAPIPPTPGDPRIELFVGYVGGAPVATSAGFTRDGVVGVYFVTTVPEARRRGYGAAVTWAAIEGGRRIGASLAYLQASPMGRPVYERMGFRWVDDSLHWDSPVTVRAQLGVLLRASRLAVSPRRKRARPPA